MRIRDAALESIGLEIFDGEMRALHLKGARFEGGYESIWGNNVWIFGSRWDIGIVNQVKRVIFDEG